MSNTELLDRLRKLHEELANVNEEIGSTQEIDDATAAALGEIVNDVGMIANRAKDSDSQEADEDHDHSELHDRIVQFEVEHPQVTNFLSQISEVLANMGI